MVWLAEEVREAPSTLGIGKDSLKHLYKLKETQETPVMHANDMLDMLACRLEAKSLLQAKYCFDDTCLKLHLIHAAVTLPKWCNTLIHMAQMHEDIKDIMAKTTVHSHSQCMTCRSLEAGMQNCIATAQHCFNRQIILASPGTQVVLAGKITDAVQPARSAQAYAMSELSVG